MAMKGNAFQCCGTFFFVLLVVVYVTQKAIPAARDVIMRIKDDVGYFYRGVLFTFQFHDKMPNAVFVIFCFNIK